LKEWLKAGILDKGTFEPSLAGVPQGGPISPIIANMCLDGLEKTVLEATKATKEKNWAPKVTTVRYADDFVITGATPRLLIYRIKPAVEKFLNERGLKLHPEKTILTNVKDGFDFLGYNFKLYPHKGNTRGLKMLIKPSKNSINKLKKTLKDLLKGRQHYSADFLLLKLNPILRGWANYHNCVVSSECFKA
jgi:RNA-directed DNA polymerase